MCIRDRIITGSSLTQLEAEDSFTYNGADEVALNHVSTSENTYLTLNANANRRKAILFKNANTTGGCIGLGDSDEGTSTSLFLSAKDAPGGASPHVSINSDGYLIKGTGLTCAFNVRGDNMSRSNADNFIVEFDDDSSTGCFDSGGDFSTATHNFTAPVSGYYHFAANIRFDGWDSGYIRMAILSTSYHSGLSYWSYPSTGHIIKGRSAGGNRPSENFATSPTLDVPATHEVYVYMTIQNETSFTVYLSESSFSGHLIG